MNKPTPEEVSRLFVRRAALQAYISRLDLTAFAFDEPSAMNLPPFEQVMGFAMTDIEHLEYFPVEKLGLMPPDEQVFLALKNGRALYQYELEFEFPWRRKPPA